MDKGEKAKGGEDMNGLLIANWVMFAAVVLYALGLFFYLVKSRYEFIQLGRKEEFELKLKERIGDLAERYLDNPSF